MTREELKSRFEKFLDNYDDPCDRCSGDDFKPSDCKYYHENWEKEGLESFCGLMELSPVDELMAIVDEYFKSIRERKVR